MNNETTTGTTTSTVSPGARYHAPIHGGLPRGMTATDKQRPFGGPFGKLFPDAEEAKFEVADLKKLAEKMVALHEGIPTPETENDDEENKGITAGYTYLGQFIDHDLTFDPMSSLQKKMDPDALTDFRTPRFDLDNLYGRGPQDQPYLYADDGLRFLLGRQLTGNPNDPNTRDLPRSESAGHKRAIIGDPRNDENVIVSQLQGIMQRFHNSMVDYLTMSQSNGHRPAFDEVQKLVRWHYQWVVVNDFLPTIIRADVLKKVLPHLGSGKSIFEVEPKNNFYDSKTSNPFMPIEFSVGAYRFGHSMVRPIYRLNTTLANRQFIFARADEGFNLNGFREFPSTWAIDWSLFFDFGIKGQPDVGRNRIQHAYKIDTSLVNPLGKLPHSVTEKMPSLAERNLIRGRELRLPSGQEIAQSMGLTAIADKDLLVGKATVANNDTTKPNDKNQSITSVSENFAGNAPLWFYVLAEAMHVSFNNSNDDPIQLGPVGGGLVAETFVGLLGADETSFLHSKEKWEPFFKNDKGNFGMAELIKQAMQA